MKRLLAVPVLLVGMLAVLAGASAPRPVEPGRFKTLSRNLILIQAFVGGGVAVAKEPDALRRAEYSNGLAKRLASEIDQAAGNREGGRAAELGGHLRDLLVHAVAGNLSLLRERTPSGSQRERELIRIRREAQEVTSPLEKSLLGYIPKSDQAKADLQQALDVIKEGRAEVEEAVRGLKSTRNIEAGPKDGQLHELDSQTPRGVPTSENSSPK